MPAPTVLHVLSQRPSLTGSGITLDALVRHSLPGWQQHAVVGVPAAAPNWIREGTRREPRARRATSRRKRIR